MLFSDQAEPIISFLKTSRKPFHLVGHSHGGSVAAIVASALPENLLSLSIYEPNAFDLIKQVDEQEEFTQLEILFEGMLSRSSSMEDSTQFTEKLLNFWLGEGAWITLSDRLKGQLIQLIDPTIGDVYAALYSPMDLTGFEVIQERTLLMFDPYTPRPALAVTHAFHHLFPHVTVRNFPKRGHLAPIFYAEEVNREIIKHIEKWAR